MNGLMAVIQNLNVEKNIRLKRATPKNAQKKEFIDWRKLKTDEMSQKYFIDVKISRRYCSMNQYKSPHTQD